MSTSTVSPSFSWPVKSEYPDEPKSLRHSWVQTERTLMLASTHMRPLAAYVESLRRDGAEVPDFDPLDGGVYAQVLFLQEKPGPKTSARNGYSGFISRNNNDPTATNCFKYLADLEMPRDVTAFWNTIPWWNGTRNMTASEHRRGIQEVSRVLGLFENLKVVVLVGRKAQAAERQIIETWPNLTIVRSYHPSNQNHKHKADVVRAWANIRNIIYTTI